MIDPIHLLTYVIRPVLKDLDLWGVSDERLVLGTACKESQCGRWLRQIGEGPALGIYQMEPATHQDIFANFLKYRPELVEKLSQYVEQFDYDQMVGNLYYATAMCRIHYLRVSESIPEDLAAQAAYWKKYYNTPAGKGTVDEYIAAWHRFVVTGVV